MEGGAVSAPFYVLGAGLTIIELKNAIQVFLNDKKADNRLNGYEEEYSLEDVINCSNLALNEINYKGIYQTNFKLDTCNPYLLILGTAKFLLSSEIALKTRNYITVNDGGTSLNREGNIDLYYKMYGEIKSDYLEQLEAIKNNLNLMAGFGH